LASVSLADALRADPIDDHIDPAPQVNRQA